MTTTPFSTSNKDFVLDGTFSKTSYCPTKDVYKRQIVNHYFYHDNDYITNWEVSRNDKLFSIVGNHEETGYLHLYTDS